MTDRYGERDCACCDAPFAQNRKVGPGEPENRYCARCSGGAIPCPHCNGGALSRALARRDASQKDLFRA